MSRIQMLVAFQLLVCSSVFAAPGPSSAKPRAFLAEDVGSRDGCPFPQRLVCAYGYCYCSKNDDDPNGEDPEFCNAEVDVSKVECPADSSPECIRNPYASSATESATYTLASLSQTAGSDSDEFASVLLSVGYEHPASCNVCGCREVGQCKYFSGRLAYSSGKIYQARVFSSQLWDQSGQYDKQADAFEALPCVQSIIRSVIDDFKKGRPAAIPGWLTTQVNNSFTTVFDADGNSVLRARAALGTYSDHAIIYRLMRLLKSGQNFVMDKSCNRVDFPVRQDEICGDVFLQEVESPISLIWDEGYNVEDDVRVVTFPLNPHHPESTYTWKASASAPLLVFDPEKTGNIRSAAQLFGNYTFSGAGQLASLASINLTPSASLRWSNGFEALSMLDANRDGQLSDKELAPISLWFDANRDGISQPGEVRDLRQEGVQVLYFKNTTHNPETGAVELAVGYAREREGRQVFGKAVDWYAQRGSSALELLEQQSNALPQDVLPQASTQPGPDAAASKTIDAGDEIVGFWKWKLDSLGTASHADGHGGYLVFARLESGELKGYSIIEQPLRATDRKRDINSIVKVVELKDIEAGKEDGKLSVRFKSESHKGVRTKTTLLIDAKEQMVGESVSTSNNRKLSYRWSAQKER